MTAKEHQSILIVDFGSQVTQLIARRLRELNVYCEIHPFSSAATALKDMNPRGIILSGGPASVLDEHAPHIDQSLLDAGLPILGICYGQQALCVALDGKVEAGHDAEYGRATLNIEKPCSLFGDEWAVGGEQQVWMSHGDRVTKIPTGFEVVATSTGAPLAVIANEESRIWAVQFHPEVHHTPKGAELYRNFVMNVCGCTGDWTMGA
ncbi:glutamine-hydrolyzing GMP synthase, partial [Maritalea sp.]|uniref:glutamine-hydrolyzing GMP synthase n=1 Tax=Maritalea sp. TaxID=2003361 RepID=UPI003EF27F02